jgi:hypothetical protein
MAGLGGVALTATRQTIYHMTTGALNHDAEGNEAGQAMPFTSLSAGMLLEETSSLLI